jgi:hypothetical protein
VADFLLVFFVFTQWGVKPAGFTALAAWFLRQLLMTV